MYEKYLLSGIMNDCYGCVEALIQDLRGYGFEVLSHNCENMKVCIDHDCRLGDVCFDNPDHSVFHCHFHT